ncbi:MAG: hypothetical protein NXI11_00915 [Proteobacteria bacterium]|nr:hypothetical protein [Pseudomonadota bacterium]
MDNQSPQPHKTLLIYLLNGATWGIGFGVAFMVWNALTFFWGLAGPQIELRKQGIQAMNDAVSNMNLPEQASRFCTEIAQGQPKSHAECTAMRDAVVQSVYKRCRLGYSLKTSFEE